MSTENASETITTRRVIADTWAWMSSRYIPVPMIQPQGSNPLMYDSFGTMRRSSFFHCQRYWVYPAPWP